MAGLLAIAACDRGSHPSQISKAAPDFIVRDGNSSIHLADYRGKIVLLNFWASWCVPCIEELPSLERLHREMPSIVVLAVSTDEDEAAYRQFLTDHNVDLITVDDPKARSSTLYGTFRWPESYIIDRDGILRRKFVGPQDWTSPEIVKYLRGL
jgi:thiol-disulfide isomerase/thioredoxin